MPEKNGSRHSDGYAVTMRAYEQDYAGWAEDTARAICEGRWDDIDRAALADEVADLGKGERHKIVSAYRVLLAHLLKARYQPERQSRSWEITIKEQRRRVERLYKENPSLRAQSDDLIAAGYEDARYEAARDTDLDLEVLPETCPFTEAEIAG